MPSTIANNGRLTVITEQTKKEREVSCRVRGAQTRAFKFPDQGSMDDRRLPLQPQRLAMAVELLPR